MSNSLKSGLKMLVVAAICVATTYVAYQYVTWLFYVLGGVSLLGMLILYLMTKKVPKEEKKDDQVPFSYYVSEIFRKWWIATVVGVTAVLVALNGGLEGEMAQILFELLGSVIRVVLAIGASIMQFVAIFWFMSHMKVVKIRPGDAKRQTLTDYVGQDALLNRVKRWLSILSTPAEFYKMGGRPIKGFLLTGPPGSGKTHLVRCMAGESGLTAIAVDGSSFRGMFWGVDVLRVIWLFNMARTEAKQNPKGICILYIDELDAIGYRRGGGGGNTGGMMGNAGGGMMNGAMMNGALNRMLVEMDGLEDTTLWENLVARIYKLFGKGQPRRRWHVVFMGATNVPEVLDPALTRDDRIDIKFEVPLPDEVGRRQIVEYYLNTSHNGVRPGVEHEEIDLDAVVADTKGATPATIKTAMTKFAPSKAIAEGRKAISQADVDEAILEAMMGIPNPIANMEETQRRQIAVHEAGHALALHYARPDRRMVRLTIVRTDRALGYMLPGDKEDIYSHPLDDYRRNIIVSMAGHVAVQVVLGRPWTGATSDFDHVRQYFRGLAVHGEFGAPYKWFGENYSPDQEKFVEGFWNDYLRATERLLVEHKSELIAVAEALLEKKTLNTREFLEIIEGAASAAA